MKSIKNGDQYDKTVALLEQLAAKGEENLTLEELEWIANTAPLVAEYEEENKLVPIDVDSVRDGATDAQKIASVAWSKSLGISRGIFIKRIIIKKIGSPRISFLKCHSVRFCFFGVNPLSKIVCIGNWDSNRPFRGGSGQAGF
jgi:hypothetical protein